MKQCSDVSALSRLEPTVLLKHQIELIFKKRFNLVLTKSLRKKFLGKIWILKGLKHMNTVIGRRGGWVLFGTKCQILG